ncbi:MAG: hypothetical protein WBE13_19870 [Candidatus Acidiferrum sp.]
MGTRTLASIEKAVRENNLRGADVGGLAVAAEEHRAALAPNQVFAASNRLERIAVEIQAAAAAGDVEAIQRLVAEREGIEAEEARRADAALEPFRRRMAGRPAEGEEADLAKTAKKLTALTAKKQGKLDKLRAHLIRDPENTDLHAKIQAATDDLADMQPQIDAILARQSQIAEWKSWQAQSQDIAEAQAETKAAAKERERDERSLTHLAVKIITLWLELCAAIEAFQKIVVRRMTIAKFRLHYDVADSLRLRINRETRGAVVRDEGISGSFTISGRFNSPEDER